MDPEDISTVPDGLTKLIMKASSAMEEAFHSPFETSLPCPIDARTSQ